MDRRFPAPIGRLRIATKLEDPAELELFLDVMLPALKAQGTRDDVLRAIQQRRVSVADALAMWQTNRLHELASARHIDVLHEAMMAYAREVKAGDADREHARKMFTTARHIGRLAPRDRVKDIRQTLETLKADLGPAAFNQARAHLQAFMRDTVGKSHALYGAVQDSRRRKKGKRKKGRPYGIAEVKRGAEAMAPLEAGMLWSLVTTGMMPEEYWERDGCRWHTEADRIAIEGTKNTNRDRFVPLIVTPVRPVMSERKFAQRLKAVFGPTAVLYDTRRTYARWLAEARLIDVNQKAYMGHSMTITQLYQMGEVEDQLLRDGATVRAKLGLDQEPVRRFSVV